MQKNIEDEIKCARNKGKKIEMKKVLATKKNSLKSLKLSCIFVID